MIAVDLLANFRRNLRGAMVVRGITHSALADACGVHRVTVTRILNGAVHPSVETCARLARAAGMRPDLAFLAPSEEKITAAS